ncbi:hypothetical protein SDC9_13488 [bioreactor metagenome]|uniref:Uncharacterized protein n=1 Tax=bioreactor metagenome TaxID=1076179 RepID=A0A644TLC9_9ZZZZ
MDKADDLGEEARDVRLDIPFPAQQLVLVHGVGADDPVEIALSVGGVEVINGSAVEERKGDRADHLGSAQVLEAFHALYQGAAGADHVVGHENGLAFHVAQEPHLADVGLRGVLAHLGVVPFLVEKGQGPLEGVGVELVAVHRSGIGSEDDEVLGLDIHDGHQLFDYLEGGVEVFQPELVEAIFDFPGMNVQGDDPVGAEVFQHGAHPGGGEAFPSLFLVLPRIGIHGQHQVDALGPGLHGRIDGDEEVEDMVVHRHHPLDRPFVEGDGLVVFDILEYVDVLTPDGFQNFGLDLSVGEEGMPGVYLEARGSVFIRGSRHEQIAGIGIVREIDFPDGELLADVVPRGERLGFPVEASLVNPGQLADYVVREDFGAGASDDTQFGWVGITHGFAALSCGLD